MAANASSRDFVVFLQGGQGCAHSAATCEHLRATKGHLFTSEGFPDTVASYGVLSGNAPENPLYSTYNRVYVPYCTMDMYAMDAQSKDGSLQFRGRPLLE